MSRSIVVRVVDKNGYGLSGYRVNVYRGEVVKTNSDGEAVVFASGSHVSIYVNGMAVYEGSVRNCDNPLFVRK